MQKFNFTPIINSITTYTGVYNLSDPTIRSLYISSFIDTFKDDYDIKQIQLSDINEDLRKDFTDIITHVKPPFEKKKIYILEISFDDFKSNFLSQQSYYGLLITQCRAIGIYFLFIFIDINDYSDKYIDYLNMYDALT
jgi:hypothetical protein